MNKNLELLNVKSLISKRLKTKLRNPSEFHDTLLEIEVAVYLLRNLSYDIILGNGYPDIQIPQLDVDIEIKNNNIPQKLTLYSQELIEKMDKLGLEIEAVDLSNDPQRIWDRVESEIIHRLGDKTNIILVGASPVLDYEEMKDFLLCSTQWSFDIRENNQLVVDFKGEFSKNDNNKISAFVVLKNGVYKGLFNPLSEKNIPKELLELLNIEKINIEGLK
ncbi:MAG: hypothetical protein ACTSP3_00145 [Candidatus Heimdallarchaeaceae archaeon]